MWSEEQIQDAVQVLWSASELGPVQKVRSTDDKDKKEDYIVANTVAYTDPIYLKAFDSLVKDGKLVKDSEAEDRSSYRRADAKACSDSKTH